MLACIAPLMLVYVCKFVDQKQLGCHVGHQEISRCCTRGEFQELIAQVMKHSSKGSILALKPRADITNSPKQGYQWPNKRD